MTTTRPITGEHAQRDIYLDFEGNMDKAPAIVGVRIDGSTEHVILDESMAPYAGLTNAKYQVQVVALETVLSSIRERSHHENRLVFGFTMHEAMIVDTYCPDEILAQWFAENYINAKKPIDRWIRTRVRAGEVPEPPDRSLMSSMATIGISYKPGAGVGVVGPTLKRLRAQLGNKGDVTLMSRGTKIHWWKVLSHNSTDLEATQALLQRAVAEQ